VIKKFITVCLLLNSIFAVKQPIFGASLAPIAEIPPKTLDLVVLFDNPILSAELYGTWRGLEEPFTMVFAACIRQRIPVLASSHLFYCLKLKATKELKDKALISSYGLATDPKCFLIFISKTNDFVLILPKEYLKFRYGKEFADKTFNDFVLEKDEKLYLKVLGFNRFFLEKARYVGTGVFSGVRNIEPKEAETPNLFRSVFKNLKLSLNNFSQMFVHGKNTLKKRILLEGHGLANHPLVGDAIAGMTLKNFFNFMNILKDINVDFIAIESCFIGKNLLAIHNYLVQQKKQNRNHAFAIVVNGATDTSTFGGTPIRYKDEQTFSSFFEQLRNVLATSNWIDNFKLDKNEMYAALYNLIGSFEEDKASSFSSICLPNDAFFSVICPPGSVVITSKQITSYPVLKWLGQQARYTKPNITSSDISSVHSLNINQPTLGEFDCFWYLLIYPSTIEMPMHLQNTTKICIWISMIPGNAMHVINSVQLNNRSFTDFVRGLCRSIVLRPLNRPLLGVSNKAWFIKNLTNVNMKGLSIESPTIERLVVGKIQTILGERIIILFRKQQEGSGYDYFYAQASASEVDNSLYKFDFSKISESAYSILSDYVKNVSFPSKMALYESTGNEGDDAQKLNEDLNDTYNNFKAGITHSISDYVRYFPKFTWERVRYELKKIKNKIKSAH
jgi:hypothetical protein